MVTPEHEPEAIRRVHEALQNPGYEIFGNNCEHFARFATTGRRESGQLQAVVGVAALVAVGLAAPGADAHSV